MAKDELTVAKINAAVKILEWSKDDLEPGVGGSPAQLHIVLAEAFRVVYGLISDAVGSGSPGSNDGAETDSDQADRLNTSP